MRLGDAGDPELVDKRLISAVVDVSSMDRTFRERTEIFRILSEVFNVLQEAMATNNLDRILVK